jgi:hypothetical protein
MLSTSDSTFTDVPEGMAAMAVMGQSGDTKYLWDPTNPIEVEAAREHFEAMKAKGFLVFKLTSVLRRKGKEVSKFHPKGKGYLYVPPATEAETDGVKADEFDPEADRYIATPPIVGG